MEGKKVNNNIKNSRKDRNQIKNNKRWKKKHSNEICVFVYPSLPLTTPVSVLSALSMSLALCVCALCSVLCCARLHISERVCMHA